MEALSKLQLLVWSKPLSAYNTFIGGAGVTYPTASTLSTAMSLPPEAVQRFTLSSQNNIACRIDRNYTIFGSTFASSTGFKDFYIDLDGRMTGVTYYQAMASVPNLKLRLLGLMVWQNGMNEDGSPNVFYLPEITVGFGNVFVGWREGFNRVYVPQLATLNAISGIASTFLKSCNYNQFKKNTIYINSAIASNTGLATAISKGIISRVVTNYDKPNSVTDLSVDIVSKRRVKFNFTIPTVGTNPIDFYEVWVEKINDLDYAKKYLPSNAEIKNTSDYAYFLEPDTKYRAYLCTVDEMYNGSGMNKDISERAISNSVEFTTLPISGYEVGMSAYLKLDTNNFDYSENIEKSIDNSLSYSGGYVNFGTGIVNIPAIEALTFTDGYDDMSFHISFGFIWNNKAGQQVILTKTYNTGTKDFEIYSSLGNIYLNIFSLISTHRIGCTVDTTSISTGVLNTLQFSYNGNKTSPLFKVFLNGVEVTATPTSAGTYTGLKRTQINYRVGAIEISNQTFRASMKELAIWKNRTMTPTEITDIDYRIKNNISLI